MDLQSITPSMYVVPTNSGTPSIPIYRSVASESVATTITTPMDSPVMSVRGSVVVGGQNDDIFIINGTVTAEDIKILYESNPNTNAYTDTDKDIVSTIEQRLIEEEQERVASDLEIYTTISGLQIDIVDIIYTTISGLIPTALSQLTDDSTHRLVTDIDKENWDDKLDDDDLIDGGTF